MEDKATITVANTMKQNMSMKKIWIMDMFFSMPFLRMFYTAVVIGGHREYLKFVNL